MGPEGTYWTVSAIFIRLPADDRWTLEIRSYDGHQGQTVSRAHGIGLMDEYVLSENLDLLYGACQSLATRMEGLSMQFRHMT